MRTGWPDGRFMPHSDRINTSSSVPAFGAGVSASHARVIRGEPLAHHLTSARSWRLEGKRSDERTIRCSTTESQQLKISIAKGIYKLGEWAHYEVLEGELHADVDSQVP